MQKISFENSFIFVTDGSNFVRYSVSSILYDFKKKIHYYLVKECISEAISKNPFYKLWGYEYQNVVKNDESYISFRTASINPRYSKFNFKNKLFKTFHNSTDPEFSNELKGKRIPAIINKIIYNQYIKISTNELYNKLKNFDTENIYCSINYELDSENYEIFFKTQYLNFGITEKYLQPIHGYVPFLYKKNIYLAYCTQHIEINSDTENGLEIMYGDYNPIYSGHKLNSKNKINFFVKRVLNRVFPNVYDYNNYLHIKTSKISFFKIK